MTTSRRPVALTASSVATLTWCVRVVRRLQLAHERSRAAKAYRNREQAPVRFGRTIAVGEEPYPAEDADPPANVFGIKFIDRTFAETVGAGDVTDAPWSARYRKARTFDGAYLPVDSLVLVYKIRNRLWIEPISDGSCAWIPKRWDDLPGRVPGTSQYLMIGEDGCASLIAPSTSCPEA